MDQIHEFVDERLKGWCIHCGTWLAESESSADHVPTKGLLQAPHPSNLPTVPICGGCNGSFAQDEEYLVVFLGVALSGSTAPDRQQLEQVGRALERSPKLAARLERSKKEYRTHGGETRIVWEPEWDRVRRVLVKNARGHVYFEFGEPIREEPEYVHAKPLSAMTAAELQEFESVDLGPAWPEVGSRMMTRMATGQDLAGAWVVVQEGVYRYAVAQQGKALVRTVLFEYLATEVYWND